jgi:2-methylcitrate dehydratase PrpD
LSPSDIQSVRAQVPKEEVKTVCEPVATKKRPQNSYDAQFSIPYTIATALVKGGFSLADLGEEALRDEQVLALARKVEYEVDPDSPFPASYSGEVVLTLADGREVRQREHINRGAAERPIVNADVERKFIDNMRLVTTASRAEQVRDLVLGIGRQCRAIDVQRGLAALG